jgi:Uma2 family endonuclease
MTIVADPRLSAALIRERREKGLDRWDEVWDGEYVIMTEPNNEHQKLVNRIGRLLEVVVDEAELGQAFGSCNVSDRMHQWKENVRVPDGAVYLQNNPAVDCGTHWLGGPDLVIEIVSPGDRSREKLPFYSSVGTREVLIIDRYPWRLELYQLHDGEFTLAGEAEPGDEGFIKLSVLPLRWRLQTGQPRPIIEVTHSETAEVWRI